MNDELHLHYDEAVELHATLFNSTEASIEIHPFFGTPDTYHPQNIHLVSNPNPILARGRFLQND